MSTTILKFAFLGVLLYTTFSFGQNFNRANGFSAPFIKENSNKSKVQEEEILWEEIVSERTLFSNSHTAPNGLVKSVFSKIPIHYLDNNGVLQPINPNLKKESETHWSALNQAHPVHVFSNGAFSLSLEDDLHLTVGNKSVINGQEVHGNFEIEGNHGIHYNLMDGIDKEFFVKENAIKYNYILHTGAWINSNTLYFDEKVEIPKGYRLINNLYNVELVNDDGEVVSTFQTPLIVDAVDAFITAAYTIEERDGEIFLRITPPVDWLNSEERVFPIIVDPIVTGPTTIWSGGTMPSCILPAYNLDSIQVTIPANVTITALNITASFYADPFTTATMGQGEMKFKTSCGTSQAFTIVGTNSTLPGTGYLEDFNIFNPLTCCYAESCNPTSFYLTMMLGRTGPATGCNTNYIRYDPFTTSWPFQAEVIGKTAEAYGSKWIVQQTSICANTCTITGTAYAYYGVPPFTYTHPWSAQTVTQGTSVGCSNGSNNFQFTLTIPSCPVFCDTVNTTLVVPPPTIVDACGNVVTGIPNESVVLKPVPSVDVVMDTMICSGTPFTIGLQACIPSAIVDWSGNGEQGTSDVSNTFINNSTSVTVTNYLASTNLNGCFSDTVSLDLYVEPNPLASYSYSPNPAIVSIPIDFTDASQNYSGTISSWNWDLGDLTNSTDQNVNHTYPIPGIYSVCLQVETPTGCVDSLCQDITVAPATVVPPNIITANEDGVNDLLAFKYLEFYPNNNLIILNRWGNLVFEKSGYTNDWDGGDLSDGTYFYTLNVNGEEQVYKGFFQIVR